MWAEPYRLFNYDSIRDKEMTAPGLFWFPSPPASSSSPEYLGPGNSYLGTSIVVWSPDKRVVYYTLYSDSLLKLYRLDAGTYTSRLVGTFTSQPDLYYAIFSLDGAYLYFSTDTTLVRVDVSTDAILTYATGYTSGAMAITPDGSVLFAFNNTGSSYANSITRIVTATGVMTTTALPFTVGGGINRNYPDLYPIRITPNGVWCYALLYQSTNYSCATVKINVATGASTLITFRGSYVFPAYLLTSFAITPDSSFVYFSTQPVSGAIKTDIWKLSVASDTFSTIVTLDRTYDGFISPDGLSVYFPAQFTGSNGYIRMMVSDNSQTRLYTGDYNSYNVYSINSLDNLTKYMIASTMIIKLTLATGAFITIPLVSDSHSIPIYSPDNSRIYFTSYNDNSIQNLRVSDDTVTTQVVGSPMVNSLYVAISPSGAIAYITGWNLDGNYITARMVLATGSVTFPTMVPSYDGKMVFSWNDQYLIFWGDVTDGLSKINK